MTDTLARRILPALAATVLVLAGCAKVDMDLTIEGDTVSGTFITALDQEAGELLELTPEDVFSDEADAVAELDGVTGAPYEDGDWVGTEYTFDQVELADMNQLADDNPDGMRITRDLDAGTYTLTMVMDHSWMADAEQDLEDPEAQELADVLDTFETSVVVTFPGEVTEHNGELSGSTVTWSPPARERTELRAVALAPDEPVGERPPEEESTDDETAAPSPDDGETGGGEEDPDAQAVGSESDDGLSPLVVALLVGLGLVVLAAVGLGIAWWLRRRNRPAAATAGTGPAAAAGGTAAGADTTDTTGGADTTGGGTAGGDGD